MKKTKIIVADDEPTVSRLIQEAVVQIGYEAITASSGKQLLKLLDSESPDIIILDMVMPEMEGIETLAELAKIKSRAAIILMSGFQKNYLESALILGKAKGLNIHATLSKPLKLDQLEETLQSI